ncbi:MAG: phosphopantetheine-binding protein [Acidimicrobiia bacterium]
MSQLEPVVRKLMASHLDIDEDRLVSTARLGEDLCIDSLAATEMTLVFEDELDIAIPDELREDVRTFGDVVALVRSRYQERYPG